MFITDIFLLGVMLIGLLRMGRRGTGPFSLGRLGRLLWKQVRHWSFRYGHGAFLFANVISVQQGVIWLSLAVVAEIPPLVRLAGFLMDLFTYYSFAS